MKDYWRPISGKADILRDVKIVDCFDQSHAADLKEVIRIFAAIGKALDDGQYQMEIALNETFSRRLVTVLTRRSRASVSFALSDGAVLY